MYHCCLVISHSYSHHTSRGYYRVSLYFIAKLLFDILPRRLLAAFVYSCISYWMIGRWVDCLCCIYISWPMYISTTVLYLINFLIFYGRIEEGLDKFCLLHSYLDVIVNFIIIKGIQHCCWAV